MSIKNFPIGLHVLYIYFPDTPRIFIQSCLAGTLRKIAPDAGWEPPTWRCNVTKYAHGGTYIYHWASKCLSICTYTTCVRCARQGNGSTWLSVQQSISVLCIWCIKCMLNREVICLRVFRLKSNVNKPMNNRFRNVIWETSGSQWRCWKLKSSGMLCCVVAVVFDVSRDRSASSSLISSYDPCKRWQMTLHNIPYELNTFIHIITTAICSSVRPHGVTLLPPYWFSWNLISEYFSTICRGYFGFIKIWQEQRVIYI
jgi:hypothetical protein